MAELTETLSSEFGSGDTGLRCTACTAAAVDLGTDGIDELLALFEDLSFLGLFVVCLLLSLCLLWFWELRDFNSSELFILIILLLS